MAASARTAARARRLEAQVGDRNLIVRVDRIELSKNLLRGFLAFDELLRTRPEWRGKVVFAAFVYPSREGLPEYLAYRQEVETLARRVNEEWATDDWTPILLDTSDDFPRSVAALRRYDVLLVNPIRDGLNLVAKEGPLLNERDGVLALSREAGVWEELQGGALEVNPFDVAGTADVLAQALDMPADERARRGRPARRGHRVDPRQLARRPAGRGRLAGKLRQQGHPASSASRVIRPAPPAGSSGQHRQRGTPGAQLPPRSASTASRTVERARRPGAAAQPVASELRRPSRSSSTTEPLSIGTGGRSSTDLRAGWMASPRRSAASCAHCSAQSPCSGTARTCSVTDRPLGSTVTPAGAACSASATVAAITSRHWPTSGCSTTVVPSAHSRP